MNYEELQFAATVLSLAKEIRSSERKKHHDSLTCDYPEKNEISDQWLKENPLDQFIPKALAQLHHTASLIQQAKQQQHLPHQD